MQQTSRKNPIFVFFKAIVMRTAKSQFTLVKRIFFCVVVCFFSWNTQIQAQQAPIGSELGLRFGVRPALSYRFMPAETHMVELLFAKSGYSLMLSALYQKQQAALFPGFYTRYGGGFSLGGWNEQLESGLDIQVGGDYYLPFLPLVVSLDVRPWMRITGDFGVNGELAATLRYVF
jgi:hypothetical protein